MVLDLLPAAAVAASASASATIGTLLVLVGAVRLRALGVVDDAFRLADAVIAVD